MWWILSFLVNNGIMKLAFSVKNNNLFLRRLWITTYLPATSPPCRWWWSGRTCSPPSAWWWPGSTPSSPRGTPSRWRTPGAHTADTCCLQDNLRRVRAKVEEEAADVEQFKEAKVNLYSPPSFWFPLSPDVWAAGLQCQNIWAAKSVQKSRGKESKEETKPG